MGDMADHDLEQGMDLWFDHLAGHPSFPDRCPYCENEEKEIKKQKALRKQGQTANEERQS